MKYMPIMTKRKDCVKSLPLERFTAEACFRNHGQTPNRLAERGGMSPEEAYFLLRNGRWEDGLSEDIAVAYLNEFARAIAVVPPTKETV